MQKELDIIIHMHNVLGKNGNYSMTSESFGIIKWRN